MGVKVFFCDVDWEEYCFEAKHVNWNVVFSFKFSNFVNGDRKLDCIKVKFEIAYSCEVFRVYPCEGSDEEMRGLTT